MALWDKIGSSGSIEDRRGSGAALTLGGGITGLVITAAFLLLSGQSAPQVLETILGEAINQTSTSQQATFEDSTNYKGFAEKVLGSTNEYWGNQFAAQGERYSPPNFVLFRDITQSGCGIATSQVGPHYCPSDQTIYLDETFFDEIHRSLGANRGDVAQAYVIAHEVGHHVQNLEGSMTQQTDSVSLELQADCYAGSWAHSITSIFENESEVNEALELAGAIGDDRIQQKTEGQINPETWTHGSSEQRIGAFRQGYATGNSSSCRL